MNKRLIDIVVWIISLIFICNIFIMPETIATHWNIEGYVDGYGSRYTFLVFALLPLLTYYGMLLDRKLDPKKRKKRNREKIYDTFRYGLTFFFILMGAYIEFMIFHPNMMSKVSMAFIFGIMFIGFGNYLPKIPQNYTLGIKTPWTLDNEIVWNKTHRVGGYGFVFAGIVIIISAFISTLISFIVLMISIFIVVLFTLIYSYYIYKQEEKNDNN